MSDPFRHSPEIAAIVRRYLDAYGTKETDTILNFYAESCAVRYVGTDAGEYWDGPTLRAVMPAYLDDRPEYEMLEADITAFESGSFGFATVHGVALFHSVDRRVDVRGTYVFTLARGRWQLVHVHHSSPVPNIDNMGFEARGLEDLLSAAASGPIDLGQTGMASVMFTDIVDSTSIAEAVGDRVWGAAVRRHLDEVSALIASGNGRVVKSLGDGTMSTFPSARKALATACDIQKAMAEDHREPRLPVRIGVHTGEIVDSGDDFFGSVINKAARIAAMAGPGEIRLSNATRVMVGTGGDFTFADPVTVSLKGLDGEHLVHRLEWEA